MQRADAAITATYRPDPAEELEAIPDIIYMDLSEAMNGVSPTVVFKSGDAEKSGSFMRNGDYQHFMYYAGYYVGDEIKAQFEATGELTMTVTLNDGTVLPTETYRLKGFGQYSTFDDEPGTIFAGLPQTMYFSLSEAITGNSPKLIINGAKEVSCYRNNNSYQNFYAWISAYVTGDLLTSITEAGEFTVQVKLADGTMLKEEKYYLVSADIDWTAAEGNEPGTVFDAIPETLSYTLSEALPAEGKYSAGIVLGSEIPAEFAGWAIEVPVTIEGTAVSYDLSALSEESRMQIVDAEDFTAGLRLGGKTLSASYRYEVRKQTVTLGYCNDEFDPSSDTLLGANSAGSGVGGAIRIPAAKLEGIKGGTITKLRIGMGKGMERVYAWIRPSLSEPAIVMKQIDSTIDGWQEVEFDTPYVITGDEIFVGYSGYQPEGVKAIRAGKPDREDGCWLGNRDKWEDMSDKGYGALYIQAIGVAVLPDRDLGIDNARLDKEYYRADEPIKASFTVFNAGSKPANGYSLTWTLDDGEPETLAVNGVLDPEGRADHYIQIPTTGIAEGLHTLTITCSFDEAGVEDEISGNDAVSFRPAVYSTDYNRIMLLENFTTASCTNCPNGHKSIENAVEGRDDVAIIAHHVGFGTDEFTIPESNAFLDFGVAGAPSLMIDRRVVAGSVPPFTIGYTDTQAGGKLIADRIEACKAVPAFASVSVTNTYDEATRTLTVNIEGSKNGIFSELTPECNYTVFLTEDRLSGRQIGAAGTYEHNHVLRSIETPEFGSPVEWDGDNFSASVTRVLDEAWKAYNMKIIVTLNKPFNANDVTDCQILNAAVSDVNASGIGEIGLGDDLRLENGTLVSDRFTALEVFTPAGIRVANRSLASGIYLVRATDADGNVATLKTFIR